ncbi:MAG: DUF5946 family protein [Candidatus Andersenbacteria bacterium]|nr:DUF5946 family protein [Candidatus Andersenbacteria bacterium]
MDIVQCVECGAPLDDGKECRDYLHEMITWDFEDFNGVGKIHHLTVLAYNLQHPSLYSRKGLENAKVSLQEFVRNPSSFREHDELHKESLASDVRDWKITGTAEDRGAYPVKPDWTILASDVVRGGLGAYVDNVKKWSESVLSALEVSGNLD